ncbi:MAG: tetratricopeptide repeat protein [Bacteroidales bacterium]
MAKKQNANFVQSKLFWSAVIVAVTFIVFFPTLFNNLTNWDDRVYVNENSYIKTLSWENLKWIFSNPYMGNYHPLTMLSLYIDYQIGELNPFVYHFTNLLLHSGNAVLVFLVVFALTGKLNISAIVGLLFGVHTLHVESVSWVSERKDVLYAFFYLLALFYYIKFNQAKNRKWYWLSIGFFLFSLLSKGQAVSLAVSLFLVDYFQGKKLIDQKKLVDKIPYLALAVIFGIIAIKAQQGVAATEMVKTEGQQRIFFSSYGFMMYIGKLIFPSSLSAYYPYPNLAKNVSLPFFYYLAPLGVAGFFTALYLSFKKSKALFFGLSFFLVNIFLLLQLLPVGGAIMADRYAYIPSFGYCFIFGYVVLKKEYISNVKVAYGIVAAYILILGVMTFERTQIWKNNFTLWTDVIEKSTEVNIAWYNRGNALSDTANYKGAIADYDQAIRILPHYYNAFINRANAKTKVNDYVGAIEDLNFVISNDSSLVNAYINRANARRELKDYNGALKDYEIALRMKPTQPELYMSRGNVLFDTKNYEGAIKDFNRALEINPKMIEPYTNKAIVRKAMGDMEGAIAEYDKAIEIQPTNSELYNNRGNIRFQQGKTQEAIVDYGKSVNADTKNYLSYKNRGSAFFLLKDYPAALNDFSESIKLNPKVADLWYTRALIKKEMGDMAGAGSDYQQAVTIDPNFGAEGYSKNLGMKPTLTIPAYEKFNSEGMALDVQGNFGEAIALFKKAIDLKPDYAEAWFNLGVTYGKTGKFGEAINALNRAIAANKNYAEAYASRGIANASQGKLSEALKDMSEAIKLKPDYAMVYFNRAMVYLNSGKKDLACSDLQKAVQLGYKEAYGIYQKECQGK